VDRPSISINEHYKEGTSKVTEVCVHPKGSLVVPEPAIPAFSNDILPKPDLAIDTPPKTLMGKLKRGIQKSTLITAPVLAFGAVGGMMIGPHFLEFNALNVIALLGGGMISGALGFGGTLCALDSLNRGDGNWTPLPPTKEYLALEASKQEAIIQPFKEWDDVFTKNVNPLESRR
jgi:hypothetical protein